jgi:hypothetical protein
MRACLHVNDRMVIHRNIKNDLDRVKANLENASSSWEYVGGLEVFHVPSIEVNTNNKIVFGLNDAHNKIEELQQHIRTEEFFLQ